MLLAVPVLVAAAIGFSAGAGGLPFGISSFANGPDGATFGDGDRNGSNAISRLLGSASTATLSAATPLGGGDTSGGGGSTRDDGGSTGGGGDDDGGGGGPPVGSTGTSGGPGPGPGPDTNDDSITVPLPPGTNPDGGGDGIQIPNPLPPGDGGGGDPLDDVLGGLSPGGAQSGGLGGLSLP